MMSKSKLKAVKSLGGKKKSLRDLQWPAKLFASGLFLVPFHYKGLISRTLRLMMTSNPAPDENRRKGI